MPNIRWKSVGLVLLAASFAYTGLYLVGPGHIVKAYVQWGYPPWAHFVIPVGSHPPAVSPNTLARRYHRMLCAGVGCGDLRSSWRLRSRRPRPTAHRPDRVACSRPASSRPAGIRRACLGNRFSQNLDERSPTRRHMTVPATSRGTDPVSKRASPKAS
jgi:hypothetical protein